MLEEEFANAPTTNVESGKNTHDNSPNADVAGEQNIAARYVRFFSGLLCYNTNLLTRNANANHGACTGIGVTLKMHISIADRTLRIVLKLHSHGV